MFDLVTIQNGSPVTTTLAIAEGTENEHASVIKLVRTYLADLEAFGRVGFEIEPFETAGGAQQREIAFLNERQATLILSYMRNTEIIRTFKIRLVKKFYEMAEELKGGISNVTLTDGRVTALMAIGDMISRVPGVKPGIAASATLQAIHEATGLPTEPFRLALPPQEEPAALNPTSLGKLCGMSAREVNLELAMRGLQLKNERGEWELTEKGREYAEAYPFAKNGHASYQILWKPKAQQLLS